MASINSLKQKTTRILTIKATNTISNTHKTKVNCKKQSQIFEVNKKSKFKNNHYPIKEIFK
jgi:hypothetical protein